MYSSSPHLVFGFHGCDKEVADEIISREGITLRPSENKYDWLGHGIYFWENNPKRAKDYASFVADNPDRGKGKIKKIGVIGAVIDLGYCLNLLESRSLRIVKQGYDILKSIHEQIGEPLPENLPVGDDPLLRKLDCAAIETIHAFNKEKKQTEYDSVRGVFVEGDKLYPNSGFNERNHIQLCIRNPNCIKGYFHPRKTSESYPSP